MLMCCVCAFSLHRKSLDMILGDEPLIFEVVLSHNLVKCCVPPRCHPCALCPHASIDPLLQGNFFPTMAASHPHLFQSSVMDESEIHKLDVNYFLLDCAMLQWCPATGEDIPTPNTNEIVVFPLSFNADSASQPATSSAVFLTTIKLG
jgi:hypothetical protein